jgi:hypothetical protein
VQCRELTRSANTGQSRPIDLWENWKEPASGEWIRTFAIITTDANELVADIHAAGAGLINGFFSLFA